MSQVNELVGKIRQSSPELSAEDAFIVPAWFWQQQLWVEDPVESDNALYNYAFAIRIRGPLYPEVLQQSLQDILQRHNVLRSIFRVIDSQLVQIVVPAVSLDLHFMNLCNPSARSHDELEARARQFCVHEALQPLNLSRGPLFRATLLRLDSEDHILLLTTHHIVYDDWSTGIFMRELGELYSARLTHRPVSLPTISFTYGDFARRQQNDLPRVKRGLDFWKKELSGGKGFHHLPTDHPRPQCRRYNGKCTTAVVSEQLTRCLKLVSQQERVSLFMTMVAAFQCLLYERSGDSDIAIGSCAANRLLVHVEGVIGRFANDLVLRTDMAGCPTFRELLARVRQTALTAFSYQDLPFGTLMLELGPSYTSGQQPIFQVMFILQDAPKTRPEITGLTLSCFPVQLGMAKYDLTVWLRPLGLREELEFVFEYSADLFEPTTMEHMLDRYQWLLESVSKDPGMPINAYI